MSLKIFFKKLNIKYTEIKHMNNVCIYNLLNKLGEEETVKIIEIIGGE